MTRIGIIGTGMVGSTAAYALLLQGVGREIVLVDKNHDRAQAEADDLRHAVPFSHPMEIRAGDYADLSECKVVVLAAGVGQKPGETRMQLLSRNAAIFREVVGQTLQHAPQAVLLVATNPVDVMTHLTARFAREAGIPQGRVLGSGTTLDTARFRTLLGTHCGVDSHHVHAYVIGEHGDSEILTWSLATIGGMPLEKFLETREVAWNDSIRARIDEQVRRAAYRIISGKGATYYGIGGALARITASVLNDQRSILTICAPMASVAGVEDVTLSLPHLIGGEGVLDTFPLPLSEEETRQLQRSAEVIRRALDELPW